MQIIHTSYRKNERKQREREEGHKEEHKMKNENRAGRQQQFL